MVKRPNAGHGISPRRFVDLARQYAAATPFLSYLISNFGVWLFGLNLANQPYPKTLAGLTECYAAGLPFLRGTIVGDWTFMAVFVVTVVLVRHAAHARLNWLVAEARA